MYCFKGKISWGLAMCPLHGGFCYFEMYMNIIHDYKYMYCTYMYTQYKVLLTCDMCVRAVSSRGRTVRLGGWGGWEDW